MIKEVLSLNDIELPDSILRNFTYITIDKWGVVLGHLGKPTIDYDYEQWENLIKPERLVLQNLKLHNHKWQKLIIKAQDLMTSANREALQRDTNEQEIERLKLQLHNITVQSEARKRLLNDLSAQAMPANLYDKLNYLGLLKPKNWKNEGDSNYATKTIQPWSIWLDYPELTPWDMDIIKRILRTKEGNSRVLEYQKIIHIAQERIRQLEHELAVSSRIQETE